MSHRERAIAIVVDASVARACGVRERSSSELPLLCADVLGAIQAGGLHVAMSPSLADEWRKHASTFSRKWLVQMFSRKHVLRVFDVPRHTRLRRVLPTLQDEGIADAIAKDLHLVELALVTDRRVVSLDDRMRLHLGNLTGRLADLRRVHWVSPRHSRCRIWLIEGAPEEIEYLLAVAEK